MMQIKSYFLSAALLTGAFSLTSCMNDPVPAAPPVELHCAAPAFLRPGDKVALVSPSFNTPRKNVDGAAAILRSWGLEPVVGKHVDDLWLGAYAGTLNDRTADLRQALKDRSVKAVLCNRGGYGSIQMIGTMSPDDFSKRPTWLIGFSDITTFHGMSASAGVMSIHGTMSSLMVPHEGKDLSSTLVRDILFGTVPEYVVPAHPQSIPGHATGTLVGGNLFTFAPNLGTWADATAADGIILFIEEVEENSTHIDRLINMLKLSGVFDRCRGVVLGEFTDCESNLEYESMEELVCSYLKDLGIPVLCGFPAGHGDVNLPLIMGAPVTLDVRADGATLTFDIPGSRTQRIDTAAAMPAD